MPYLQIWIWQPTCSALLAYVCTHGLPGRHPFGHRNLTQCCTTLRKRPPNMRTYPTLQPDRSLICPRFNQMHSPMQQRNVSEIRFIYINVALPKNTVSNIAHLSNITSILRKRWHNDSIKIQSDFVTHEKWRTTIYYVNVSKSKQIESNWHNRRLYWNNRCKLSGLNSKVVVSRWPMSATFRIINS